MKLSIVSSLKETKHNQEKIIKKFSELCIMLNSLGYDGIELSILEPERIDIKKINEIKDSYSLEISAIGTGNTYIRYGYSLGHQNEQIRNNAIKRIQEYIDFAYKTGSKVIIGLIRGRFNNESSSNKEKSYIKASLRKCCQLAENKGVTLLFEPINQFEIDSYNTISEAIELINQISSNNLKLLIDTFHMYLEEDPGFIWEDLKEITHLVSHLHLADTNRRTPGTGHFDFKTFLEIFKRSGYNGFASIETIMKPSFEEVAKNSSEYLRLII
ncbi:MAG: sugar phosphate isomerase/epimerase family protein [Candidatus Hodarchaeota archaeon]